MGKNEEEKEEEKKEEEKEDGKNEKKCNSCAEIDYSSVGMIVDGREVKMDGFKSPDGTVVPKMDGSGTNYAFCSAANIPTVPCKDVCAKGLLTAEMSMKVGSGETTMKGVKIHLQECYDLQKLTCDNLKSFFTPLLEGIKSAGIESTTNSCKVDVCERNAQNCEKIEVKSYEKDEDEKEKKKKKKKKKKDEKKKKKKQTNNN